MAIIDRLGVVLAKEESTYKTVPSMAANADSVYVRNVTPPRSTREAIPRPGHTTRRQGHPNALGAEDITWGGYEVEIGPVELATGATPTERPLCHPFLIAAGFKVNASVTAAGILQYDLEDYNHGSISVKHYQSAESGAAYIERVIAGYRAPARLVWERGGILRLVFGEGKGATITKGNQGSALAPTYTDGAGDNRLPFTALGLTLALVGRDGTTFSGSFTRMEIDLGLEAVVLTDAGAANGIEKVILVPTGEGIKVSLRVESQQTTTIDWEAARDNREVFDWTLDFAATDAGGGGGTDALEIGGAVTLDNFAPALEGGREHLDLELVGQETTPGTPSTQLYLQWTTA